MGARRYWRVRRPAGAQAVILVVYPPAERPAARRFSATTALLANAGVRVPRILAQDLERGLMAVEDLGRHTLYDRRGEPWEALAPYFEAAARVSDRIAALPVGAVEGLSPPLDRSLLRHELRRTREAFFEPLGLIADTAFGERWERATDALCAGLGARPARPCHRDFMVRNLVPQRKAAGEAAVGVLDHQDLRLGPPWYDLASLANDSLFPPRAVEERWLAERLAAAGPGSGGEPPDPQAYHAVAAQRTLKAVGTYAAFAARGDGRHLPLIAPTLGRALEHLSAVAETAPVAAEARERWAGGVALLDWTPTSGNGPSAPE